MRQPFVIFEPKGTVPFAPSSVPFAPVPKGTVPFGPSFVPFDPGSACYIFRRKHGIDCSILSAMI